MPRTAISLDPRLLALSEMCPVCASFADIGTDHGRLGAYLLQTGRCGRAQFTDISAPSLAKAKSLVALLGLSDRAAFCVGDGAAALSERPDVAAIAGMGGDTISGILERGRKALGEAALLLQPNVDAPLLREALEKNGYCLEDERIVRDGRRLYVLLRARPGSMRLTETERTVGPILLKKRPDELMDYAAFRIRVLEKALQGARRGGDDTGEMEREMDEWKETVSWQTRG